MVSAWRAGFSEALQTRSYTGISVRSWQCDRHRYLVNGNRGWESDRSALSSSLGHSVLQKFTPPLARGGMFLGSDILWGATRVGLFVTLLTVIGLGSKR